ncbi:MAG: hypothetical protein M3137_12585 [Actinomycetota bacterium]|nr:hypothetical protein [Actinomycetota bacterium]
MIAALLLVVLICVVVGIVGFVVHGLFWLLIIAAIVFLATVVFGGTRLRGGRSRR